MPGKHSVLPPSSAKRWINCPPSAIENANAPESDSVHAREGTVAHALAETEAGKHFGLINDYAYSAALSAVHDAEEWSPEMTEYISRHVEILQDLYDEFPEKPVVKLETRVDMRRWAQECWGTADVVMIGIDTVHIIDLKYGKGVEVYANHNPQMMLYALGVLDKYGDLFDFETVKMSIIQPRLNNYPSTFEMKRTELLEWAEEVLKPAAELAVKGEGNRACGDWCRWCCNNGNCAKQLEEFEALPVDTDPNHLTDAQITHALELGEMLNNWLDAIRSLTLQRCLDGKALDGWKAVEGRSNRTWSDQQKAFEAARLNGVPDEMLYERKPLSVAGLEKLIGKKKFSEIMSDYIARDPGKPTLAKASDKRDAITNETSVEDDFK